MAKEIWNREGEFEEELLRITPAEFPAFLRRQEDRLIRGERPWAAYMRAKFREKGVLQQEVFLAADLSERYGYKLIAEEKHTTQRDVILRLCLAAQFRLDETQEALILYGMAASGADSPRRGLYRGVSKQNLRHPRRRRDPAGKRSPAVSELKTSPLPPNRGQRGTRLFDIIRLAVQRKRSHKGGTT